MVLESTYRLETIVICSLDSRVVANGLPGLVLCSISKYVTMGCSRIFEVLHVHVQPILCIPY